MTIMRPPKTGLLTRVAGARDLATRSWGLLAGAAEYARLLKQGKVPGPLLLTIRAANELARRILEQPSPTPTPAQRRTLLAAGAQLRAMTSRIIVSAEGHAPESVESELAELVRRTLTLVDRVTAEAPEIEGREPSRSREVIDVEGWVAPRSPRDD